MDRESSNLLSNNRIFAWIAIATAMILCVPLLAMQFTREVKWGIGDFLTMGTLLFATGSCFVILSRKLNRPGRILAGVFCVVIFLYIWAELAVGVFFNFGS